MSIMFGEVIGAANYTRVTLSLEIAQHSLTRCYYVAVWCPNCGSLRAALPENLTSGILPCPSCREEAEILKPLGEGGTSRTLPFWE